MARPKKENLDYFSHDVGMRNHRKIKALRNEFGMSGFGVRCMLLEHIGSCNFLEAKRDKLEQMLISGDFGVSVAEMQQVVSFCVDIDLLQLENEILKSQSLIDRMKPLLDKRTRERNRVSVSENPHSKVKQIKGKESKEKLSPVEIEERELPPSEDIKKTVQQEKKKFMDNVRLLDEEHQSLIYEYGTGITQKFIRKLNIDIGSKGNKYDSHYFTILHRLDYQKIGKKIHAEPKEPTEKKKPMTPEQKIHTQTLLRKKHLMLKKVT